MQKKNLERIYQRQLYKQQLANISVHNLHEKRYFKGVAGVKGQEGDIFGMANLLKTESEGEKTITDNLMKKSEEMYHDLRIQTFQNGKEVETESGKLIKNVLEDAENYDIDELLKESGVLSHFRNEVTKFV